MSRGSCRPCAGSVIRCAVNRAPALPPLPLRARITIFGAALVAVGVLGFAVLVNALATANQPLQQDRDLRQRAAEVARSISLGDQREFQARGVALAPIDLSSSPEILVEVYDGSGALLYANAASGGSAPAPPAELLGRRLESFATAGGIRFHARHWARTDVNLDGTIVTGQAVRVVTAGLRGLRAFLVVSALITVAAALAAAWLIAGRALTPLRQVATAAEEIGKTGDLERRLPETPDELGALAVSFNRMLETLAESRLRLTEALETQRRFVADASHELRTPLTSIRTNAGFLVRHPDLNQEDRKDALVDICGEAERMSRLVEDLLTLARAEAGAAIEVAPVDLGALVAEVARQAGRVHPDRFIATEVTPEARALGDSDSLRQLLWILVDNAVRHTRSGGRIWLRSGPGYLAVSDDGTGIPPAALGQVFDRFFRADPARSGSGAGLGLSIAAWIATQHGGAMDAANNPDRGATVTLRLPS